MKKQMYQRTIKLMSVMVFGLSLILVGCSSKEDKPGEAAGGKINVVTTIGQIAEPISVIGGDKVNVQSLMGPGVDPHLYNATQGDIKKLEGGDIIFYSGLHLEGNMAGIFEEIGKSRPVLAIGDAISKDQLLTDDADAIDPHIWFDIELWKQALSSAVDELQKFSPENADFFEENKVKYFQELDVLSAESKEKLSQIEKDKRVLVTAHDAFGYFGRMHDMKVVGLQGLSTEDEIGITDIDETIQTLLEYSIPAVFVESSINPNSIKAVIEGAASKNLQVKLGGELFSDAMGKEGTAEGTYIGMYRHNVDTIHKALTGEGE